MKIHFSYNMQCKHLDMDTIPLIFGTLVQFARESGLTCQTVFSHCTFIKEHTVSHIFNTRHLSWFIWNDHCSIFVSLLWKKADLSTYLCPQMSTSNIVSATGPEGEMTKEDVSEDIKGDSVLGWISSHHRPVIHPVASAPMPSDCGEGTHIIPTYVLNT